MHSEFPPKSINYYTHIITLPMTLKQVLFLLDPVFWILTLIIDASSVNILSHFASLSC